MPEGATAWQPVIVPPHAGRRKKPRRSGVTMVIDKGLGLRGTRDLLETAAEYLDFLKLAFGSSALFDEAFIRAKVALCQARGVAVYPGGTLLELAVAQGRAEAFLRRAKELGFACIEISEGTIELESKLRSTLIRTARSLGFTVVSEVGKKDGSRRLDPERVQELAARDLADGSSYVIIEGRDSGRGVGIYREDGTITDDLVDSILEGFSEPHRLMWEAPLLSQQQALLLKLGHEVNLGNVQPQDLVALESLRQGLRGDTLQLWLAGPGRRDSRWGCSTSCATERPSGTAPVATRDSETYP